MRNLPARAFPPSITGTALPARSSPRLLCGKHFGSTGILPVGSKPDVGPWGTYDMAGNVKEWIWTEAEDGKRYVLGGAWTSLTTCLSIPMRNRRFCVPQTLDFAVSSMSIQIQLTSKCSRQWQPRDAT